MTRHKLKEHTNLFDEIKIDDKGNAADGCCDLTFCNFVESEDN